MRRGRRSRPTAERLWEKVQKDANESGCWLWLGSCTPDGHGQITRSVVEGGGTVGTHTFSFELAYGPVPEGKEVDHICRIRSCVRPDHLDAVTHRENLFRGETWAARNAAKTHCPKGHPYDYENTHLSSNGRTCRACHGLRPTSLAKKNRKRKLYAQG